MIQILRPDKEPASLKRWGEKQTRLDCAAYHACPGDYNSGVARFVKKEYYSAKPVKALLVAIHHSKCCYCEKKLWPPYLHVEHFRPRYGVRQTLRQKNDELPGYYWLSYRWDNLLLACLDCNSKFKGTLFPLANSTERARSHYDDIRRENPLFVDPAGEDPRKHIQFADDLPVGITEQGRVTIDGIGLRRKELREDRLAKIAEIEVRFKVKEIAAAHPEIPELQEMAEEAREFIEAAVLPDAEFSSMAIDYIAGLRL